MISKKIISIIAIIFLLSCADQNKMKNEEDTFLNPILAGFYPDPSLLKVEDDYYLITSTFAYFPGIPVFHSKDLKNWKQIGHVLDRPEQLNLNGLGVSKGIFAPAIKYYNGTFYVTSTIVDGGGNFVVTAKNPAGPWSNPTWLPEVNGIDPSLFFDDDKAYLIYNSEAPDNKPIYPGHRTIRMYEFDYENLKVKGDNKIIINGGVDIAKKPIWIEGPHIYKKDGLYFLIPAEGGTAEDHSQVVFRSKNIDGPYIPWENNPILTQRHLDPKREYPVICTGHASLVETDNGEWWAAFLGCRPYKPFEKNYYNTGRETFLAPVKWIDGWPVINPDFEEVQYRYPLPLEVTTGKVDIPFKGNFTLRDDFINPELHKSWIFLRTPVDKWYNFDSEKGELSINLRPETCAGNMNPSLIARRQQHSKGYGSTAIRFAPSSEYEKAGLLIFQDETHFYFLCKSLSSTGEEVVQLYKSNSDTSVSNMELITSDFLEKNNGKELVLKIEVDESEFNFFYGYNVNNLKLLAEKIDATYLKIKSGFAFTGNVYAMYATSLGNPITNNKAVFDWFEYNGNDDIYNKQ